MALISKAEAAAILGKSERGVERYAKDGLLEVKPQRVKGRTRDVPMYEEADVRALAERLRQPPARPSVVSSLSPAREVATVTTPNDNADNADARALERAGGGLSVGRVVEVFERLGDVLESLRAAADSAPVWLTREQALEASGMPSSWFDAAVRGGQLAHIGEGRGRRYHREDVRRYAESLRPRAQDEDQE